MNVSQLAVYRLPNAIYSKRALKRRNSIRALKRWTTEALDVHSTSVWIYPDDTSVEGCAACESLVEHCPMSQSRMALSYKKVPLQ